MLKCCTKCQKDKPRAAGKDGLQAQCRDCQNATSRARRAKDPVVARAKERAYENRPERKARNQARHVERVYGMPQDSFELMKDMQGGCCATCYRPTEKLWVDHDHETGWVRGLLCPSCNIALGQVQDDVDILKRLIDYVEDHRAIAELDAEGSLDGLLERLAASGL